MRDALDRLPGPQRNALQVAFGLSTGAPPDRFLLSLAALSLLADVAADRPLLCIIDDAQWLDRPSAQVLVSAARRLKADSVVLLLAERQPDEPSQFSGLPELVLEGVSDAGARQLFGALIPGRVDESVLARVVAEGTSGVVHARTSTAVRAERTAFVVSSVMATSMSSERSGISPCASIHSRTAARATGTDVVSAA